MVRPVVARSFYRGAVCVGVIAASGLLGCSSPRHGSVSVTPVSSLSDQPVHIVVRGLDPDRTLTVGLGSTDALGHVWTSQAVFRSDGAGTVDLVRARAVSGSYRGVDPMGLIDALHPASSQATAYYWHVRAPQRFQVTVTEDGSEVAVGEFSRGAAGPGVRVTSESLAATGFFGQFWKPPAGSAPRAAVLEFGGSEGGLDGQLLGAALASAGYPTLNIAYFGEPGLPSQLKGIPLEYFAGALRWLARQPGVLPSQIYVSGVSRGSEAALLLGAYYPSLVHGVIASSPGNVSLCSYPDCTGAAWTLHGQPLPYTRQFDNLDPTDNPAAVIPVQNIRGPVLLDCGTDDLTWISCAFAQAIQRRLTAAGDRYAHVLYRYVGAGHLVGGLIPYEPISSATASRGPGDTPLANADADARLWPDVLSFLAHPSGHTGTFTAPATPPPLRNAAAG